MNRKWLQYLKKHILGSKKGEETDNNVVQKVKGMVKTEGW